MPAFRENLSAREVDRRLRQSLEELRLAEKNAVLWFAEVMQRKLYRELGHSSIHQYAAVALGFGKSKTAQFIRLSESLRSLPKLRRSVAKGELSWTKAREVAKVASPQTEKAWIAEARNTSRSALERKVSATRRQAKVARGKAGDQAMLEVVGNVCVKPAPDVVAEVPVYVSVRFTPEQYARYEALLETLRKQGKKPSREELLLAGLESLVLEGQELSRVNDHRSSDGMSSPGHRPARRSVEAAVSERDRAPNDEWGAKRGPIRRGTTRTASETAGTNRDRPEAAGKLSRVNASPYQVVVQVCETCERAEMATSRGLKPITPGTLRTILCDAKIYGRGEKNRSSLPPSLKIKAIVRDRHRCQSAGCGSTRFLNVHHIVPREAGGPNTLENLITLCSACHHTLHDLAEFTWPRRAGRLAVRSRQMLGVFGERAEPGPGSDRAPARADAEDNGRPPRQVPQPAGTS